MPAWICPTVACWLGSVVRPSRALKWIVGRGIGCISHPHRTIDARLDADQLPLALGLREQQRDIGDLALTPGKIAGDAALGEPSGQRREIEPVHIARIAEADGNAVA